MSAHTYSFKDVVAAIQGPNGNFTIGNGAGPAEEGISIQMVDDKSSMLIGADGSGMHSLHAGKAGTITVRLLKTSPANQQLSQMYNLDTASSAVFGRNVISIRDMSRGDVAIASACAFKKLPDVAYAKDGGIQEWVFNSIDIEMLLGNGQPSIL